MPTYRVVIETSVEVEASSPEEAAAQAEAWAREDLSNSNAVGEVFASEEGRDESDPCYVWEP